MPFHKIKAPSVCAVTLLIVLLNTGCDKYKKLEAEQLNIDAQREKIVAEINVYDQKMQALGNAGTHGGAYSTIKQAEAMLSRNEALERTAKAKLEHWTKMENAFTPLRASAEAYKAKHLR